IRRGAPQRGDIIFTREAPVGEVGVLEDDDGVFLGQRTMMYRTAREKADNYYLFYTLSSRFCQKQIEDFSNGGTVAHMRVPDCGEILINLPPLPEQKKIAQILSTWDKAITTTEQLLANSQQQKKALMQQLLTGKKRLLDKNGVRFSGAWKTARLGQIGEIKSAGVDKKIVKDETPVRLLNFTDVFKRSFIYSNELNHWVTAPESKVVGCNVVQGDVFFTPSSETRNEAGIPAVAVEDIPNCCYSYHVVRFRISEQWDLNFKAYAFTTLEFRKQVNLLADGSGQRYVVSQDAFRNISVTYPDFDEQQAIGRLLRIAEDEIITLQQKLDALKLEKKALMQQLLTGKRRVKLENKEVT
ncbi:restriction endonuclease subunit S, partial [Nitrosomonas sp. ANs5]|uniref:restriction endonuclease subunit S n=1 Tax=Nitrosomonas sp. ANs5 TaxID=3423941 RepID=UPI003D33787A